MPLDLLTNHHAPDPEHVSGASDGILTVQPPRCPVLVDLSKDARESDMADDTRESQPVATPVAPVEPLQKFPKGVILGKDGKPCRSCNSFAAFKQTGASLKPHDAGTTSTATTAAITKPPADCPADVETLGRSTWTLLHSIAATYPTKPTATEQSDILSFVKLFSKLYPCWVCAEDFQSYIKKDPVKAGSRSEFGNWLCGAHNEVNQKLGKPVFDCSLWEERWRTGWKDGRCD